jgi:DNA repair protein SbcC/Rad50
MLNWFLRKRKPAAAATAPVAAPEAPARDAKAAAASAAQSHASWAARLDAARGDDAALLEVARSAPQLELKLAAADAIAGEAALRQAEREFRSHDRKVHQRLRLRLAAAVARREAQAKADALIVAAEALLDTTPIAANRLAALDRDWAASAASLAEPDRHAAFAALRGRLDAALAEQDAQERAAQWSRAAASALDDLQRALEGADERAVAPCMAVLRERLEACPPVASAQALAASLQDALGAARQMLDERAEATRRAAEEPLPAPPPPSLPAKASAAPKVARSEWRPRVEALLQQAEAALDEGSSGGLNRHLQDIDATLTELPSGTALPAPLRARLQALHAERQRLRGWQQWGGAVARESLVDAAEKLAHETAAAQAGLPAAKLNLKAHGDAIRALRARWKELDRSGAAAAQTLWQRFDAALTLAHAPLAEQQAKLVAARAENLAAREALLSELGAAASHAATPREALQALDAFQRAWRQLGPVAHTVPAAMAAALRERHDAALALIEAPLAEARAGAQREREVLVAQAEALAAQEAHDATAQVRDLQAQWQQRARALPLTRAVETALWARFRQATDAVFARREAAQQARDAQAAAGLAARETLLARIEALAQDASAAADDLARALAQIEREWQALFTPLPRAVAEGLEARWRDAHAAALRSAEARRLERWQAHCDALLERLALCEQREDGGDAGVDEADLARRWQAASSMPAAWQRAFDLRWSGAQDVADDADKAADRALLELEDGLGIPPAPAQVEARRDLKLRALKDALEGRAATRGASEAAANTARLTGLLARRGLDAAQRARLRALVDAARRGAPGRFALDGG